MALPCLRSSSCPHWKEFLLCLLLVICVMPLLCICCCSIMKRLVSLRRAPRGPPGGINSPELSAQQSTGMASATIRSLPAVRFRKGIKEVDGHGNDECSICLRKFHEGEWLRPLPNCAHVFHVRCIDAWFRSHSTCPLCRRNVSYDFNDSNCSSVSTVAPLETLRREDSSQERDPGYQLLQLEILRNPEFRMGTISGYPNETESDESFQGFFSPVERPSYNQRRTVEELLQIAHDKNGESSSRNLASNNQDYMYAQRPLA